jgi:hypothetical protein
MKKRINHTCIVQMLDCQGLTYEDVAELSAGKIKIDKLKKILPNGGYLTTEQIKIMKYILNCQEGEIIDPNENIADNLPSFIDPIISQLFYRLKNSYRIVYRYYTKEKLHSESFRNRYGQANRILKEMTNGDNIYVPETTDMILKLIIDDFGPQNALSDIWNRFTVNESSTLSNLISESGNDTQEQRLFLLFFYVHTIFYTIFLDDLLASVLEHCIERKSKYFKIYKDMANRNEILHLTLKDRILFSNTGLPAIDSDPVKNMKLHLVECLH